MFHLFFIPLSTQTPGKPWSVQRFPVYPLPPHSIASTIINIPYQGGAFITTDEPTMIHHYHPQFTVHIRVPSWCCIFSGFGQMCSSLWYHMEYFPWWAPSLIPFHHHPPDKLVLSFVVYYIKLSKLPQSIFVKYIHFYSIEFDTNAIHFYCENRIHINERGRNHRVIKFGWRI